SDALVFARELGDDVLLNRVRFARAEIELTTEGSTEFSIRDMDRAVRGVEAADTAIPHFVDMLERYGRCVQSLETGEGDEMRERARRRADELGIELFPGRSVERTG
ncbi:MAG: hypothetical protein ABEL76_15030, partial [Bradymonadaceae bacterium]